MKDNGIYNFSDVCMYVCMYIPRVFSPYSHVLLYCMCVQKQIHSFLKDSSHCLVLSVSSK